MVLNWRNSPDVAEQMYTDDLISPEHHSAWFERVRSSMTDRYWIVEVHGRPVGVANLSGIDERQSRSEWAFYIGEPDARGMLTPGAVEYGVLSYAFDRLGLRKVSCEVLATNARVAHLHRRFGFQDEGLLRQHVLKHGEPVDVCVLAMLRDEWKLRRSGLARLFGSSVTVVDA